MRTTGPVGTNAPLWRSGRIIRGGYDLGELGAAEQAVPLHTGLGREVWSGTTSVLPVTGGTSGTGAPVAGGGLARDWRGGDVW